MSCCYTSTSVRPMKIVHVLPLLAGLALVLFSGCGGAATSTPKASTDEATSGEEGGDESINPFAPPKAPETRPAVLEAVLKQTNLATPRLTGRAANQMSAIYPGGPNGWESEVLNDLA